MNGGELADADPIPPSSDQPSVDSERAPAHDHRDDAAAPDTDAPAIEAEEELSAENGEDGGVISRPAKRRKLEELAARRSTSRAVSPPWRSFAADGPTTIFDNGIRKSSRVNKDAPPPTPEPVKRNSRHATKSAQTNGTPRGGGRQTASRAASRIASRTISGSAPPAKGKTTLAAAKKASTTVNSPARKSERQRRSIVVPTSPARENGAADDSRRRTGRPRRMVQTPAHDPGYDAFSTPAPHESYAYEPSSGLLESPDDGSVPTPRIRLKLRRPDPPNRHPHHAPPATKHQSFADWLQSDDPLEGEEAQKVTPEKAVEEAERRLQIVDAAEDGVLSLARCSIFTPQAAEEPPRQYGHWDHVVAHVFHFNKLLKEEKTYHRRIAKTLAREALDYWKEKYKRKTHEEIEQEEAERAALRYKQLVKDVKDTWANVKAEIDKERVAKWEEEQLQLGHKAMDDMFNQAQEILGRNMVDSASSFVSDDRDTEGDVGDFESGSDASDDEKQDENMSSSSDSEEGAENDEDANLTAEQLQQKYGQLPDLPDDSSAGKSEDDEEEQEEEEDDDDDEEERTPEPTPDPDLQMEDAVVSDNPFAHTNGYHDDDSEEDKKPDYIDPATVELEQVDKALLDSDDEGDKASRSGSEAWSSDEDSGEEEDNEDEDEESDSGADEGGGSGLMGFLAPSEIKKIKEAARPATMTEDDVEMIDSLAQDVDELEHAALEESEVPKTNGDTKPLTNGDSHVNGDNQATKPAPSIEVTEAEPVNGTGAEKSISRSRSRQTSSPPRTEIPSLLRGTLREYQHDGLDWLANLYDSETNGILADEMGLGKTIQTISLLAYIAVHRQIWGPHLVVVPTSVMLNWEMEFKKWCPGFKILTYYGDINERKRKRMGWRTMGPDMYNVVITSYQLILQDAAAFKMRAWQYLILDEAHNIKNFKSQRWQTMLNLRTERRLLLTGTPLQNNIDELWSLLYFLMPAGFAGEGRIAGLEEFTMALKNPTSQILDQGRQQLDAEAQKIVKKLHEVLRPYLLRRLKADVEKQMPAKYEHVVYCKLSKRQRQLYDGFMGRASTKEILSSGNYMSIINCLMSLRKVCNHPDLFETRAIVTSMAMPKSVAAEYEIKDLLIRKRLNEGMDDKQVNLEALNLVFTRREQTSKLHARRSQQIRATRPLEDLIERQTRRLNQKPEPSHSLQSALSAIAHRETAAVRDHLRRCVNLTRARTRFLPIYGKGLIDRLTLDYQTYTFGAQEDDITTIKRVSVQIPPAYPPVMPYHSAHPFMPPPTTEIKEVKEVKEGKRGKLGFRSPLRPGLASEWHQRQVTLFHSMIPTIEERAQALDPLITRFTCVTPSVAADDLAPLTLSKSGVQIIRSSELAQNRDPFHEPRVRQSIAFPDKRLLQYDCGKLQRLAVLLRDLQAGGHRALIFTQMTKVLDILEQFLNIHGHRYLRLDGATKVEQRQILTDRFNNDPRILCFILSSRSGGLGINLTGADTVIFYDLDWNPAMDKQCQDRSHRIGQTRDVHIYKFVSEYTIEANILRKSNQKRLLDDVIIQKGDFTTDTFNRVTWRDALDDDGDDMGDEAGAAMDRVLGEKAGLLGDARVMKTVEDREDQNAASIAQKEIVDEIHDDQVDFNESTSAASAANTRAASETDADKGDYEKRHVDEYMLDRFRDEYGKVPYKPPTDRQRRNRKGHDVHRTHRKKKY